MDQVKVSGVVPTHRQVIQVNVREVGAVIHAEHLDDISVLVQIHKTRADVEMDYLQMSRPLSLHYSNIHFSKA